MLSKAKSRERSESGRRKANVEKSKHSINTKSVNKNRNEFHEWVLKWHGITLFDPKDAQNLIVIYTNETFELMKGGYILFNGKFYREKDPLFTGADLYRLNAGIRESFRSENNQVMFAEDNFNYFVNSLLSTGLPIPAEWDFPRFIRDVSRLLNKNHLFLAARVVIHFIPSVSGTDYLVTSEEIPPGYYPINEGGLLIDFYDEGSKPPSTGHAYEPSSRFLWLAATRTALLSSRNNLILSNNKGFACESIGGTFGYLSGDTAVFPSPASQGYCPPILGVIMECAEQCGFKIIEKDEISHEDLLHADELFLTDNCLGVQLVLGLNSRRYYTTGINSIALKLSELAKIEHPLV